MQTLGLTQPRLHQPYNRLIHPIPLPLREVESVENESIKSTTVRLVDFIKDRQDFSTLDIVIALMQFLSSFMSIEY